GIYQSQERAEASYAESYFGGDESDYDAIRVDYLDGRKVDAVDGDLDAYELLHDLAQTGFERPAVYMQALGLSPDGTRNPSLPILLDTDNLMDYMLVEYFTGDQDGPGSRNGNLPNNFTALFNINDTDGFKWFQWESEYTLGNGAENLVTPFTWAGNQKRYFNPHWLHEQLVRWNATYRQGFGDRVHKHCFNGGVLTPAACTARLQSRAAEVEMAIIAESARWGDTQGQTRTKDDNWQPAVDEIVQSYLPNRAATLVQQFTDVTWYPDVHAPVFAVDGSYQHGGSMATGAVLTMKTDETAGEIYYTLDGSDPRNMTSTGPQGIELLTEDAAKQYLLPLSDIGNTWQQPTYDDSGWTTTSGIIGFDLNHDLDPIIDLDITWNLWALGSACYLRIPFSATDVDTLAALLLKIRYNDGFVAYLNGIPVATANAPENPQWDSIATAGHAEVDPETFDISTHLHALQEGDNLLAIHALNQDALDFDFLLGASLIGHEGGLKESGMYTSGMVLDASRVVKACTKKNGQWSALNEAVYSVGPIVDSLRITEIMYHPSNANEEFIELTHIGNEPLNLNRVRFTQGINFTFSAQIMEPNQSVLLVRDLDAFTAAYGTELPVVGQYQGSLDNGGENITLADATGQTILDFAYQDAWFPSTDGDGLSLTIRSEAVSDPATYNAINAWYPSLDIGGSPGQVEFLK
ncbi:lamin tail domain-containing protein, partial [Planctomycetota bacterium]